MGTLLLFLTAISPIVLFGGIKYVQFRTSVYRKETGNSFLATIVDKGANGEYLTTQALRKLSSHQKILLSCYLPNAKGETTEVDIICINETGVYALESKNFSGWIFGREEDRNWTQTFSNGKKYSFYNPIKQNKTHIKAIEQVIPSLKPEDTFSIIVFSERCELKKIAVCSSNVKVVKRPHLGKKMKKLMKEREVIWTPSEITDVYNLLKVYSNASEQIKDRHIEGIKKRKDNKESG